MEAADHLERGVGADAKTFTRTIWLIENSLSSILQEIGRQLEKSDAETELALQENAKIQGVIEKQSQQLQCGEGMLAAARELSETSLRVQQLRLSHAQMLAAVASQEADEEILFEYFEDLTDTNDEPVADTDAAAALLSGWIRIQLNASIQEHEYDWILPQTNELAKSLVLMLDVQQSALNSTAMRAILMIGGAVLHKAPIEWPRDKAVVSALKEILDPELLDEAPTEELLMKYGLHGAATVLQGARVCLDIFEENFMSKLACDVMCGLRLDGSGVVELKTLQGCLESLCRHQSHLKPQARRHCVSGSLANEEEASIERSSTRLRLTYFISLYDQIFPLLHEQEVHHQAHSRSLSVCDAAQEGRSIPSTGGAVCVGPEQAASAREAALLSPWLDRAGH